MTQAAWEAAMRDGGNVSYCPVCQSQGDAPCRWPDGRPRKANHQARNRRATRIADRRSFSQAVKAAAQGQCQAAGTEACQAAPHYGQHAHHLLPRGRGGSDDPTNGRWLCWQAHDWVHDHPTSATAIGLLRQSS